MTARGQSPETQVRACLSSAAKYSKASIPCRMKPKVCRGALPGGLARPPRLLLLLTHYARSAHPLRQKNSSSCNVLGLFTTLGFSSHSTSTWKTTTCPARPSLSVWDVFSNPLTSARFLLWASSTTSTHCSSFPLVAHYCLHPVSPVSNFKGRDPVLLRPQGPRAWHIASTQ